ncbi:Probable RNA-directed DNA polymerase from transposon BS [Eumeta japonica]|uniref:Probable RNA-directed DNA polymerase from transposon BS n=1 Tax=Eumeta variegata TaxID=151549 RepID=A0A4C1YTB0_EUMVA|nr:Probable RNA-directed DNA polymerase from transposon BS [Eumeta japonica]
MGRIFGSCSNIQRNITELKQCTKEYGLDLVLVQETFLIPTRPKACALPGYVQLRTDRTNAPLGGTAIYYKRSLHCYPIDLPTLTNIEATGCRLAMTGHEWDPAGGLPKPMIKITDWKRVSTALEEIDTLVLNNIPDVLQTTDEIDSSIGALTNHIQKVVKSCSREAPVDVDRRRLPADALELLRAKNAALRHAYAYPTRENRSRARALQRRVRARMLEVRNEEWKNLMEDITPSHQAFWKLTKALKLEGYLPTPPLKKADSSLAVDDVEKAECLVDSLSSNAPTRFLPLTFTISLVSGRRFVIKPPSNPETIYLLFLLTRTATSLPSERKPKSSASTSLGNPPDLPGSYRPISLLSGLGKIYERILKSRLSEYLFSKGLIINEQFGFRPNHSCPQQALRLVEYITEDFKTKKRTVAVFFDVAKAFDRVWHAGLIYKLYQLNVPDRLILIIHHYLTDKHFMFRHENTPSTRRLIRAGVPQDSTLSLLLYSAYTNDIPRPSAGVQLALFADDTCPLSARHYRAQHLSSPPEGHR